MYCVRNAPLASTWPLCKISLRPAQKCKMVSRLPAGRSSAAPPPKKMEVPFFLEPIPVIDGPMLVDRAQFDQEKKMASNASEPLGLDDVSDSSIDRAGNDLARKCCKRNCFQLISSRVWLTILWPNTGEVNHLSWYWYPYLSPHPQHIHIEK